MAKGALTSERREVGMMRRIRCRASYEEETLTSVATNRCLGNKGVGDHLRQLHSHVLPTRLHVCSQLASGRGRLFRFRRRAVQVAFLDTRALHCNRQLPTPDPHRTVSTVLASRRKGRAGRIGGAILGYGCLNSRAMRVAIYAPGCSDFGSVRIWEQTISGKFEVKMPNAVVVVGLVSGN
jgi:hypothetical protein